MRRGLWWAVMMVGVAGCAGMTPEEREERAGVVKPEAVSCFDAAFLGSPDSGASVAEVPLPCWEAWVSARERVEADRRAAVARMERERAAGGGALEAAEGGACRGLSEAEVALSPFYFKEDVLGVSPLMAGGQVQGAVARFRGDVPRLDAMRLEQVMRCHLERARVVCDPEAMDYCPLALGQVEVTVRSEGGALVVELRGEDEATAAQVLQRVESLREAGE